MKIKIPETNPSNMPVFPISVNHPLLAAFQPCWPPGSFLNKPFILLPQDGNFLCSLPRTSFSLATGPLPQVLQALTHLLRKAFLFLFKMDSMTLASPPVLHTSFLSYLPYSFLSLTYRLYVLLQAWWMSSAPKFNSVMLTEEACWKV